jgi:hypothetical protein
MLNKSNNLFDLYNTGIMSIGSDSTFAGSSTISVNMTQKLNEGASPTFSYSAVLGKSKNEESKSTTNEKEIRFSDKLKNNNNNSNVKNKSGASSSVITSNGVTSNGITSTSVSSVTPPNNLTNLPEEVKLPKPTRVFFTKWTYDNNKKKIYHLENISQEQPLEIKTLYDLILVVFQTLNNPEVLYVRDRASRGKEIIKTLSKMKMNKENDEMISTLCDEFKEINNEICFVQAPREESTKFSHPMTTHMGVDGPRLGINVIDSTKPIHCDESGKFIGIISHLLLCILFNKYNELNKFGTAINGICLSRDIIRYNVGTKERPDWRLELGWYIRIPCDDPVAFRDYLLSPTDEGIAVDQNIYNRYVLKDLKKIPHNIDFRYIVANIYVPHQYKKNGASRNAS